MPRFILQEPHVSGYPAVLDTQTGTCLVCPITKQDGLGVAAALEALVVERADMHWHVDAVDALSNRERRYVIAALAGLLRQAEDSRG